MTSPTPLRLDTAACDRCGRCAPRCVDHALRVGPGYISVDWDACDGCGRCAEACDRGGIVLRGAYAPPDAAASAEDTVRWSGVAPFAGSLAKWREARTTSGAGTASRSPSWGAAEALLVLAVAFALLVAVQSLPSSVTAAPVLSGIVMLAQNAVLAGTMVFIARRRGLDIAGAFRLDRMPESLAMMRALGAALACWVFSLLYRSAALTFGIRPPSSDGVDLTRLFGTGMIGATLTVVTVAIAGPLVEEMLIRGVVLQALRTRVGRWPAIILSALAFAALHASAWSFLPLLVLGVALGWIALGSRSLWPTIIAHVAYNAVFVSAALYVSSGLSG